MKNNKSVLITTLVSVLFLSGSLNSRFSNSTNVFSKNQVFNVQNIDYSKELYVGPTYTVKNSEKGYNIATYNSLGYVEMKYDASLNRTFLIVIGGFNAFPFDKSDGAKGAVRNSCHTVEFSIGYNGFNLVSYYPQNSTQDPYSYTIGVSTSYGFDYTGFSTGLGLNFELSKERESYLELHHRSDNNLFSVDFDLSGHNKRTGDIITGAYSDFAAAVFSYSGRVYPSVFVNINVTCKFHERVIMANYYGEDTDSFRLSARL